MERLHPQPTLKPTHHPTLAPEQALVQLAPKMARVLVCVHATHKPIMRDKQRSRRGGVLSCAPALVASVSRVALL